MNKVLHYDFSQEPILIGSNYILIDKSGNGRDINLGAVNYWDIEDGIGHYVFNGSRTLVGDKIFNDDANQSWTVTAWLYLNSNAKSSQYLNNFNLGNRIVHSSSNGRALLYINSGVNDAYTYSTGAIPAGQWIHVAFVLNTIPGNLRCQFYLNGTLYGTSTNFASTDAPYGFAATHIIGNGFEGKLADMRIYDKDLTTNEILNLYEAREMITKDGEFLAEHFVENIEPTINYWDFEEYERCWNGGGSTVCGLRSITGKHSMTFIGQASVASAAGYAYVYPFYTVPVGKKYTFSCVVENFNAKSSIVGLRIRDGNNGDNLRSNINFTIQPNEKKRIFVTSVSDSVSATITPALSVYSDVDGYINIEITEIQVENKLYPTPYINGEREQDPLLPIDFNYREYKANSFGIVNFEKFNTVGKVDHLINFLVLEENVLDYSGNKFHATANNITYAAGKVNSAALFSGSSSYISLENGGEIVRSFSMWIKTLSFPGSSIVAYVDYDSGAAFGFYSGSKFIVRAGGSGSRQRVANKGNYIDNGWNHIVINYDSSGVPDVYVNGEETTYDGTTNYWTAGEGENQLGRRNSGNYFIGQIQNFKTFDRELTLEEIRLEYNFFNKQLQIHESGEVFANDLIEF